MNNKFDSTIYPWMIEYGNLEPYTYLDGDPTIRNQLKTQFISGEIVNPTLDYPKIDYENLLEIEKNLIAFKQLLLGDEVVYEDTLDPSIADKVAQYDHAIRTAYIQKINEKLAGLRLLKAVYELTISTSEADILQLSRKIRRYNEFIFGKPNQEVFKLTLSEVSSLIDEAYQDGSPLAKELADEIANLVNFDVDYVGKAFQAPSAETFITAQMLTSEEFSELINIPNEGNEILNAQEIQSLFQEAMQILNAQGWNVVIYIESSRTAIHVSQESQEIIVPSTKKLSRKKIIELILHELGTHVARRINGERTRLLLLGIGLDRYKDDEGIATMREQILQDGFEDFSGFEAHLAVGLAYGLDNKQERDFRETFEILWRIFKLRKLLKNKSSDKDIDTAARDQAWNRCIRTFRGTACSVPGVCFTKDIFYRESNIEVWRIWKDNPLASSTFNVGKFDPANPRHLMILSQLDIMPNDLDRLENQEA